MNEADEILVEDRDGIRMVTLNRPERLNALTQRMRKEIATAVAGFGADDKLRVLILTGAGRGFCSGSDLSDTSTFEKATTRERSGSRFNWHLPFDEVDKPTICALNGVAAGAGLGLALSCDLIVASEDAYITPAFSKLALSPDNGVAGALLRRIGYARSLHTLLLSPRLSAAECERIGLVDTVLPSAEFAESVRAMAVELAAVSPLATMITKRLLKDASSLPRHVQLAYEELLFGFASDSPEAETARAAFLNRARG